MTNTAKLLVEELPGDWAGKAQVYEVDPPVAFQGDPWTDVKETSFVIVSACVALGKPETLIFPALKQGDTFEVADWMDLKGSYVGGDDHVQALKNAGYEVV